MNKYLLTVVIEKDDDAYFAFCPVLKGCSTQGNTYEEALANIKDAVQLYVEDMATNGEEIPTSEMVSVTTVEVQV